MPVERWSAVDGRRLDFKALEDAWHSILGKSSTFSVGILIVLMGYLLKMKSWFPSNNDWFPIYDWYPQYQYNPIISQ